MPEGMQAAGTAMHRSASRFALEAQNSSASGDARPAMAALATLTQACVACHAGYKFK
jgi:cytochrome c556